ncbi:MAG TPA: hypothetical protein VHC20_00200 [Candidatus Paceibacterota bacterium]|nr:hypothetical protein [Candidatus Paceibacterota bacterium]
MATKQIQCPNCKGFNTTSISPRAVARMISVGLIILGSVFSVFIIGLLIGIPMFLLGLVLLLVSFFLPENGRMRCRQCHFVFMANSQGEAGQKVP